MLEGQKQEDLVHVDGLCSESLAARPSWSALSSDGNESLLLMPSVAENRYEMLFRYSAQSRYDMFQVEFYELYDATQFRGIQLTARSTPPTAIVVEILCSELGVIDSLIEGETKVCRLYQRSLPLREEPTTYRIPFSAFGDSAEFKASNLLVASGVARDAILAIRFIPDCEPAQGGTTKIYIECLSFYTD
jgi:hypothetical protein